MSSALRPLTLPALIAALLVGAAVARADEPTAKPSEPVSFSFEDDKVFGDTAAPSGEVMTCASAGSARRSCARAAASSSSSFTRSRRCEVKLRGCSC